ncbi:regulator of G-protein signaling loco isoform X2 [Frankliniella occidentalis]|uniref:Regulator of G-protein signaling loco isoform X2 n=1 Tax=Frankliniella occidentalis TaxID=133901 RepID=A0A6J1RZX6_FRAOC|nr:regulator of G-protein signaling loco isoform X2 [Frankliniella occidentalis]
MHPIRRRKKRPNYGVRTVEVRRGKNGFGFTISGQQPCILSCIVAGSPAETAGLRAGDYLVAVDGRSVSKMPHDDVVRLIGCSSGVLKLQIAENYYSDSSDDDVIPVRPKPKYMHKPRSSGHQQQHQQPRQGTGPNQQNRIAKVVHDLRTGAMFEESLVQPSVCVITDWSPPLIAPTPPPRAYQQLPSEAEDMEVQQFVIGYLGTIEIPKQLQPGSKLQIVCACVRKLRAEKRSPTPVVLRVLATSVRLVDARATPGAPGASLAEYPAARVLYCGGGGGSSPDGDRRHFGLVTSTPPVAEADEAGALGGAPEQQQQQSSSACHVFAVDPKQAPHEEHASRAATLSIDCGAAGAECYAFPRTSEPVLRAVQRLYADREEARGLGPGAAQLAQPGELSASPHPSHAGSANSSNSDSGIGFRDDSGHQSDRNDPLGILMVDLEHRRLHVQGQAGQAALLFPLPAIPLGVHHPLPEPVPDRRLAVRAMPDPHVQDNVCCPLDGVNKTDSAKRAGRSVRERAAAARCFASLDSVAGVAHSADDLSELLSYKLSPKVFGVARQGSRQGPSSTTATHSLEDLTLADPLDLDPPHGHLHGLHGHAPQWGHMGHGLGHMGHGPLTGSLQELRSFVLSSYEDPHSMAAPLAQPENDDGPLPEGAGGEEEEEEEEGTRENGGVPAWSASFERLLEDPAGLHTFAEFLKKEFSHENIYFWVACERYRHIEDAAERKSEAQAIFDKHLCLGAPEPVNVDSHARQVTQEQVGNALPDLFLQAQKQIFNLMKFDSYPRFIKSELYKECLLREISGQELPFNGSTELDQGLKLDRPNKLKKSRSDVEDRRRKSLLPWHRKNRSKSKDRGESEYSKLRTRREQYDTVSIRSDVTSSRSSLASWDLALRGSLSRQSVTSGDTSERENSSLCRVILPDGATTVVQTRYNETVSDLIQRLLEKRGLHYQHFQVFLGSNPKAVAPDEVSSILSNKEVRVEPRVVFRLDLPNRKTVGVKSRPGKTLGEVLRPVLHKYGYRLHLVTVCMINGSEMVSLGTPVSSVDNQRLQVLTRSSEEISQANRGVHMTPGLNGGPLNHSISSTSSLMAAPPPPGPAPSVPSASLDEITNRVFEELLQGKAAPSTRPASDQGSVRSDDWGSEHSSGIFGRFLRRDSAYHDKSKDFRGKSSKKFSGSLGSAKGSNTTICSVGSTAPSKPAPPPPTTKPPLIAKWKPGAKLLGQSESDELYEGLKRAQRSRLEDQRGTEINFELPDFLKDKENAPQSSKKLKKFLQPRRDRSNSVSGPEPQNVTENSDSNRSSGVNHNHGCSVGDHSPSSLPVMSHLPETPRPPPLPPKPKYLRAPAPPRVPAGEITNRQETVSSMPPPSQPRRPIFLDETVSSFV